MRLAGAAGGCAWGACGCAALYARQLSLHRFPIVRSFRLQFPVCTCGCRGFGEVFGWGVGGWGLWWQRCAGLAKAPAQRRRCQVWRREGSRPFPFTCRASCAVCAVLLGLSLCPSMLSACKAPLVAVVAFPFTWWLAFIFILAAVFLLWLQGVCGDVSGRELAFPLLGSVA